MPLAALSCLPWSHTAEYLSSSRQPVRVCSCVVGANGSSLALPCQNLNLNPNSYTRSLLTSSGNRPLE